MSLECKHCLIATPPHGRLGIIIGFNREKWFFFPPLARIQPSKFQIADILFSLAPKNNMDIKVLTRLLTLHKKTNLLRKRGDQSEKSAKNGLHRMRWLVCLFRHLLWRAIPQEKGLAKPFRWNWKISKKREGSGLILYSPPHFPSRLAFSINKNLQKLAEQTIRLESV